MHHAHEESFVRKHWQLIVLIGLALGGLACGSVLIVHLFSRTDVPDPGKADIREVGEFLESDGFRQMPSDQRGNYVDRVLQRHMAMTPAERAESDEALESLNLGPDANFEARDAFWLAWGIKRAADFDKLPPESQDAYVDVWIGTMEVLGGEENLRQATEELHQRARDGKFAGESPVAKFIQGSRTLGRSSTAEERAKLGKLGGALFRRMKARYGLQ